MQVITAKSTIFKAHQDKEENKACVKKKASSNEKSNFFRKKLVQGLKVHL